MEDGQIVEKGTHDELLAAGGAYARLYPAQFSSAVAESRLNRSRPVPLGAGRVR